MISINQKKLIRSLRQKKYRIIHELFLAEGHKIVSDLIAAGSIHQGNLHLIAASPEWLKRHEKLVSKFQSTIIVCTREDLKSITSLVTPPEVIAVLKTLNLKFDPAVLAEDYCIVLDSIRDPGNLGSIIRTANWFGINTIICSEDSVDIYNNKVVQASMGAIMNVRVYYQTLDYLFETAGKMKIPVYATMLDGTNMFEVDLKPPGLLVFGNESAGISPVYKKYFTLSLSIPGKNNRQRVESLNVSSAVSSLLTECRRKAH